MTELLPGMDTTRPPDVETKAAFAGELGVSKARVTQLIEKGLPLTPNGRVPRRAALDWYDQTIAPHRRKVLRDAPPAVTRQAELDALRAETPAEGLTDDL